MKPLRIKIVLTGLSKYAYFFNTFFKNLILLTSNYCKNSCISHTFLLKLWAQNLGCGLSTRPLLSRGVNPNLVKRASLLKDIGNFIVERLLKGFLDFIWPTLLNMNMQPTSFHFFFFKKLGVQLIYECSLYINFYGTIILRLNFLFPLVKNTTLSQPKIITLLLLSKLLLSQI